MPIVDCASSTTWTGVDRGGFNAIKGSDSRGKVGAKLSPTSILMPDDARIPLMEKAWQHAAARTQDEIEALITIVSVFLRQRESFYYSTRDVDRQEVWTESTLLPWELYDHNFESDGEVLEQHDYNTTRD